MLKETLEALIITGNAYAYAKEITDEALFNYRVLTGEDQAELVVRYKPRETAAQQTQRIEITNSRTSIPSNKVAQKFKEVERADTLTDNIWYESDSEANNKNINELKALLAGMKFNKRLHELKRRLTFFDPNALILFNYDSDLNIDLVEFTSDTILAKKEVNGSLEMFSAFNAVKYKVLDPNTRQLVDKNGTKYYAYDKTYAITYTQVGDVTEEPGEIRQIRVKNETLRFAVLEVAHNLGVTPAISIGYIFDPRTKFKTFVSPLYPAKHLFLDLINTKSEYDLHKALHGFDQKYAYSDDCDFKNEARERCDGGTLRPSGAVCPKCNGSGIKIHTSVQDVILIKKPKGLEEHIPLDRLVHYVQIPEYVISRFREDIDALERDITQTVLSTNVFDRKEIQETATGKRLDLQSFYNVLTEYNISFCDNYKAGVHIIARIKGINDGLVVEKAVTRDYRLETLEEMFTQRKLAKDAGSGYETLAAIDVSILAKQSQDNDTFLQQIVSKERFRPFRDKNQDETLFLISQLTPLHPTRILWTYFDDIFETIYSSPEYKLFHLWAYKVQKQVVDQIVSGFIKTETLLAPVVTSGQLLKG